MARSSIFYLLTLFCLVTAKSLCRKSPSFLASSFVHSSPIASEKLARNNFAFPNIIPLLFGNYISNYKKVNKHTALLTSGISDNILLAYSSVGSRGSVSLKIVNHHPRAFPVSFGNSRFFIYLTEKTRKYPASLHIRYVGVSIDKKRKLKARNAFARAFVNMMMDNARLVLGLGACSSSIPTISGLCNNPFYPTYGVTFTKQLRPWNGNSLKMSGKLPNPRYISNTLCRQKKYQKSPRKINLLMVMFGQFLDHDIVLTPSGDTASRDGSFKTSPEAANSGNMRMTRSDPLPYSSSKCCRTPYSPSSGEWNQYNRVTAYIDGSGIYGSDHNRVMALRSFKRGKLFLRKTNRGHYLAKNSLRDLPFRVHNANDNKNTKLYAAGDIRANENPVLLSLHTIFAREHNRVCKLLRKELRDKRKNPQTDEWLFQQARRIVIAELQNIVYQEFIPHMLGRLALDPYNGYKPQVDASMDIMFTTAAFRWGHSALRNHFVTKSLKGKRRKFLLQNLFFNAKAFYEINIEDWLLGAIDTKASNVDLQHADAIRDFLFNPTKKGILDLAALNIQRGRDHGLQSYIAARRSYGLPNRGGGLGDIHPYVRTKIMNVYKSVDQIDPFVGGLAERTKSGSLLGPFFHAVVKDQFQRLRDGDRFYYENVKWGKFLSGMDLVKKIRKGNVRLADVIIANTKIEKDHLKGARKVMQTS